MSFYPETVGCRSWNANKSGTGRKAGSSARKSVQRLAHRVPDGTISRELFADEQRRIATDIANAETQIDRLEHAGGDGATLFAQAADLLRHFPELYAAAPPMIRRTCKRTIFSHL